MEPVRSGRSRSDRPVDQSRYLRQITTTCSICTSFSLSNMNQKFQRLNLPIKTAISSYRHLERSEVFSRSDFDRSG